MFHVSQLKKVIGPVILVSPILPNELSALQVPEKILQQRVVNQGSRLVVQVSGEMVSIPGVDGKVEGFGTFAPEVSKGHYLGDKRSFKRGGLL
jgi:hypothetical protein